MWLINKDNPILRINNSTYPNISLGYIIKFNSSNDNYYNVSTYSLHEKVCFPILVY